MITTYQATVEEKPQIPEVGILALWIKMCDFIIVI